MGVKWEWISWQRLLIPAKMEFWAERTIEETTQPEISNNFGESLFTLLKAELPLIRFQFHKGKKKMYA